MTAPASFMDGFLVLGLHLSGQEFDGLGQCCEPAPFACVRIFELDTPGRGFIVLPEAKEKRVVEVHGVCSFILD